MANVYKIKEGSNYDMVITPQVDTTGQQISVRAISTTGSGSGVALDTASGVSANTDVTLNLQTRDLSPDDYYLEFFVDYGTDSQAVLNNGGENVILKVEDTRSI